MREIAPVSSATARLGAAATAVAVLLVSACGPTYHMGDTIQAKRDIPVTPDLSQKPGRSADEQLTGTWQTQWQNIQSPADKVGWEEHFQVCGLQYRFRHYDELFRCLSLLDAKIAAGGAGVPQADLVQRGSPATIDWLRATAYAELGDPQGALQWAERAWQALPKAYRTADPIILKSHGMNGGPAETWPVEYVGYRLGSAGVDVEVDGQSLTRQGRNNPAALDLRPWMLSMSLSVQRSLLYQQLGRPADSDAALAELGPWEQLHYPGGLMSMPASFKPFRGRAQMISIGPSFARGQYQRVALIYETLAAQYGSLRRNERVENAFNWALFMPLTAIQKGASALVMKAIVPADARLFSVAVEDVANALVYAQSLKSLGRSDEACQMLDTILAMPELQGMGNLYWVTLYERARIALAAGERDKAIAWLGQSIDAIESVRSSIGFEAAKIGFAGDKQAVYAATIEALVTKGEWARAFGYVERAKARALVDLLAERRNLPPPPAADERVQALFAQAATGEGSLGVATDAEHRRGIQVVADARASLADSAPHAASLLSVQQVPLAQISGRLDPGDCLIEYFQSGDSLYAFVLDEHGVRGVKLAGAGLDDEVRAFRDAIGRRDARALDLSRRLYDRLLRPVLAGLQAQRLTIAPHGILHYLPFAALSDGQLYLIDRYSVRMIPSASVLAYLPAGRSQKPRVLLALGNPDLGDRALDLPNAQNEAVQVAALFPNSKALVRADASKSAVRELGSGFTMLHFATHGHFNAEAPLSSGLYLSPGQDKDGVLTVGDLYSLRLDADLVTLSACETGLGKVVNGDDVIGLTRGFLYAGARTIVASLWEVDDAATAQLMESFYRNLGTHDKRESLQLAQLDTRNRHPEPWYWAGFNVVGKGD